MANEIQTPLVSIQDTR